MSTEPGATYRPVSGLAVAGFALSLLFGLGMLAAAVVAFRSRLPLQIDPVWLLAPLVAAGLSLAGLIQVRKSEGTRVGAGLARWGLGISVVIGLGYLAYHAATEEALRQQAAGFTERWFDYLREGKTQPAFWETLEPSQRDLGPALPPRFLKEHPKVAERLEAILREQGRLTLDSPEFQAALEEFLALQQEINAYVERRYFWGGIGRPGRLATFQGDPLVQLLERWRDQAQIESQGIRSWSYVGIGTQGRYQVQLGYRLRTPEGHVDAVITVLASQLADDPRRYWQVLMAESGLRTHLLPTPLGKQALELSDSSRRYAEEWLAAFAKQRRDEVFLGTLPPAERQARGVVYAAQLVLSALAQPLASATLVTQPEAARLLYLPGFAAFASGGLVDSQDLKADGTIRPTVVKHVEALFALRPPPQSDFPRLASTPDLRLPAAWRVEGGQVIFEQPFFIRIPPRFACDGTLQVASTDPQLLGAMQGKGSTLPADPGWWIKGMKLRLAGVTKKD